MAAYSNLFTDKETTNWFKASIGLNVAKQGLTNFLDTELQNVHAVVGRSCGNCQIEKLIPCPTKPYCNKRTRNYCSFHKSQKPQPCPTCDHVKQNIILQHRYGGPSWRNTHAENWAHSYWAIGQCFLPPDGYSRVFSVQELDFNGVISIMLNCLHFQTCLSSSCLSPPPPDKQCPLEKVRQIGRDVHHAPDCKVTDADLQDYFQTLITLLADPKCLQHDPFATQACKRLIDLQNGRMSIEELGELLKEANQTLKHAKEAGERFSEEAERTLEQIESKRHDAEQCIERKIQDGAQRLEQAANKLKPDKNLGIKHPTTNKPSMETKKQIRRQKKPVAKSGNSSDCEWADCSESSDSSDSSYENENSKVKPRGNTAVYSKSKSKKTLMGHRKSVLNITKIGKQTGVEKLFSTDYKTTSETDYSLEEACDFDKRQQEEIPAETFVNLRERELVRKFDIEVLSDASHRVGIIRLGDVEGTCFRVGDKKIMTALNVIRVMLERSNVPVHSAHPGFLMSNIRGQQETQGPCDVLSKVAAISKLKDAYVDFSFIKDDLYRFNERSVFYLKPLKSLGDVPFFDNNTNCIVLEILPNTNEMPMPPPFSMFCNHKPEEGFYIIGHPGGSRKTIQRVNGYSDSGNEKTKKNSHTAINYSKTFLALHGKDEQNFPFDVAGNITCKDRFLFHCTLSQGAPGAPGVVEDKEGRVFVVTMFLHGYPDWYYDQTSLSFRDGWPKHYCFEQGASMEAIFEKMQKEKPELCEEIFDTSGKFCKIIFDQRGRPEILHDLCNRFGRKSLQLKFKCEIICNEIRSFKGVKHVYSAYKTAADNNVTFVVTIENDQDKQAVETFLKDIGIEYDIKMLQFKNNETNGIDHIRNTQQTDEEIKWLRECIKTHAPQLFFKHTYLSIIQGCMRQVNNEETEETSNVEAYLELFVHAKGCIPIEEDPFEKNYNGIPVHVREGVFLPFTKHADDIHDHIRMGCTISRRYERKGTLGLFFEHAQYGLCGISSAHVLLCDKELEQCKMQLGKYLPQDQKEVYQPRFPDLIGKLVEVIYKEGDSSLPGLEIGLIAIENRKPEDGRFPDPILGQQLVLNYSSGRGDTHRGNNRKCIKFGSATNYTTGTIETLPLPNGARTLPWILQSGLTKLTLYNQIRIEPASPTDPFADPGDSGAPVFVIDGDGQPVCIGIVTGGVSGSRTVMVTPITAILEELGISKFKTFEHNLETLQQDMHAMKQDMHVMKHQLSKFNLEQMQQDMHVIKNQLAALVQHLSPPRSANA